MNDSTRRGFLAMTGAGAAAVGAAAIVPSAFASNRPEGADKTAPEDYDVPAVDGALVAYVHDVKTGEVSVMVGEHEVTVVDKSLAAKIARASRAEA
jgi:hypothetical protein